MLRDDELRRILDQIKPAPLNGPFSRFVPFDKMVSRETGVMTASGPTFSPAEIPDQPADLTIEYEVEPGVVVASGFAYVPPKPRPLWGIGSIKNGGRYNKRDSFEVIYLAEDPITALAEVDRVLAANPKFSKIKGPPVVYISVDGILDKTLDLTLVDIQNDLATSHQELTGAWIFEQDRTGEAPTQRLGRVAFECNRFCSLRFPSAKNPDGFCVAAFPDRFVGASYLEVFDPFGNLAQRLPA